MGGGCQAWVCFILFLFLFSQRPPSSSTKSPSDIKLAFSLFSKFLGRSQAPGVIFSFQSPIKKKKKKKNSSCLRQNFPGAMSFLEMIKAAVFDNWKFYKLYSQAKQRDALSTAILLGCSVSRGLLLGRERHCGCSKKLIMITSSCYYSSCLSFPFLLPNKGQSLTVVALGSVLLFLCKPHCHFYFNLAVGVNLIVFHHSF